MIILLLQSLNFLFQFRLYSNEGAPHEIVCGSKLPSRADQLHNIMRSLLAALVGFTASCSWLDCAKKHIQASWALVIEVAH